MSAHVEPQKRAMLVDVIKGVFVPGLQRLRQTVIGKDDVPFGIRQVGVGFAALKRGSVMSGS